MPRKNLDFEKEQELSLIWGTGDKRKKKKQNQPGGKQGQVKIYHNEKTPHHAQPLPDDFEDALRMKALRGDNNDNDNDDAGSTISFVSDTADEKKIAANTAARTKAKKEKRNKDTRYRLHCFVAPGTTRNDVREVFEGYGDPEVELRTSQKGNALNKTHYAVLTFKKKTLGLWAAKHLDGSNQRDSIGTNPLVLNMFLSRDEQKMVKRRLAAKKGRTEKASSSGARVI